MYKEAAYNVRRVSLSLHPVLRQFHIALWVCPDTRCACKMIPLWSIIAKGTTNLIKKRGLGHTPTHWINVTGRRVLVA